MQNTSAAPDSSGPQSIRKEQLLREFGDKMVQLGWQNPNSPELKAHIDMMRQQASEHQIEGLTKAFERQIAATQVCGCNRRSNDQHSPGCDEQPILTISPGEVTAEGYATPVATLKTALWTGLQDDANAYFECFTPEIRAEFQRANVNKPSEPGCATGQGAICSCQSNDTISGVRVWAEQTISAEEIRLDYQVMFSGLAGPRCRQPFRKVGDDWKISGPPEEIP
jgi:hypothetical protein